MRESQISRIQQLRCAVVIVNAIKDLSENLKSHLYYTDYSSNSLVPMIANKAGIRKSDYRGEAGQIDITDYVCFTLDDMEEGIITRERGRKPRSPFRFDITERFNMAQDLIDKTKAFEASNVPQYGPAKTMIGEIFRAAQYIEYRAFNDGDMPWDITSPTFASYIFLLHMADKLNYSTNYNPETGLYEFQFKDQMVRQYTHDNQINVIIEGNISEEKILLEAQLIELLESNQIQDRANRLDSRDFTEITMD